MPRTRLFKSGNSQAVRIPVELANADTDIDLEITRVGDVITIFPARNSLKDAVAALRRMPNPPTRRKPAADRGSLSPAGLRLRCRLGLSY
jgi:antitoxin VapB